MDLVEEPVELLVNPQAFRDLRFPRRGRHYDRSRRVQLLLQSVEITTPAPKFPSLFCSQVLTELQADRQPMVTVVHGGPQRYDGRESSVLIFRLGGVFSESFSEQLSSLQLVLLVVVMSVTAVVMVAFLVGSTGAVLGLGVGSRGGFGLCFGFGPVGSLRRRGDSCDRGRRRRYPDARLCPGWELNPTEIFRSSFRSNVKSVGGAPT